MATLAMYAFVANYVSASMAPALPLWNREFHRDPRPAHDLMQLVAVCRSPSAPPLIGHVSVCGY
jgi:hypothetical protein